MRYSNVSASKGTMKAYSIDLREKIIKAYEQGDADFLANFKPNTNSL
jgi:hypothetical protein